MVTILKKKQKRTVASIAIIVFAAYIFALVFEGYTISAINKTTVNLLNDIMMERQFETTSALNVAKNNLLSLSTTISNSDYTEEETRDYLNEQSEYLGFENTYFVDSNGIAATMGESVKSFSEHISKIEEDVYFSSSYPDETSGSSLIAVATELEDSNGNSGYILAEFSLNTISQRIVSSLQNGGHALIVTADGEDIFTTSADEASYSELVNSLSNDLEAQSKISSDINNQSSGAMAVEINGVLEFIRYEPLGVSNWQMIMILAEDGLPIMRELKTLSEVLIWLSLGIFVCVMMFAANALLNRIKVEEAAAFDDLTGLLSFSKFKNLARIQLQNNPNAEFAMMRIDIRNFKAINEVFNFEMGNKVLRSFAKTADTIGEETFIISRVSGDDFMMFAGNGFFDDFEEKKAHYESHFKNTLPELGKYPLEFNYGRYIIHPTDNRDINDIINKTNMAHTVAKSREIGKIYDYDDSYKAKILRHAEITSKMESALKNREFIPFLQPKINLEKNELIGAEALVRWFEPNGAKIYPDEFIPLFESNGFIVELDKYILDYVCAVMRKWMDSGITCVPISVNFSRVHLLNPQFISDLVKIVDGYNIPHEYIEVELTETTILDNEYALEALFTDLHKANFPVAIDDFGAGYSSLGMLKSFRVDTLKLDKSFLTDNKGDGKGEKVIEGIISLAHSIDMKLVAEGVEDKEQLDFLKSINCDAVQGYYFSRPIPLEEFREKFLSEKV